MNRSGLITFAGLVLLVVCSCGHREPVVSSRPVMIPPRIDLRPHELIGVLEFTSDSGGELGPLATRRFIEWARRDQGLVRMVELGSRKRALRELGRDRWDPAAYTELGSRRGLRTILAGQLIVSDVKPQVRLLPAMASGHVTARVQATLEVRLIEAATGASLWSASAVGIRDVGHVSMSGGGRFAFDADDPERAYGDLVDNLVEQTTRDFRVTWERR